MSLAIKVLEEELHCKLRFQIIGLYDVFSFCNEVLHKTIPKLSVKFGESGWRHPWGVELYVAARSARGSYHCRVLSSVWILSDNAKCDRW